MPRSLSAVLNWLSTASRQDFQVAAVLVEQHAFLAQRDEDRSRLLEQPGERVELGAGFLQALGAGRSRIAGELIAAVRERLDLLQRRRADALEGFLQGGGALIRVVDGAELGAQLQDVRAEIPDAEAARAVVASVR